VRNLSSGKNVSGFAGSGEPRQSNIENKLPENLQTNNIKKVRDTGSVTLKIPHEVEKELQPQQKFLTADIRTGEESSN
jgi:hypothetical protein